VNIAMQNMMTHQMKEFPVKIVGVLNASLLGGGSSQLNEKACTDLQHYASEGVPQQLNSGPTSFRVVLDANATLDQAQETKTAIIDAGYTASTTSDMIGVVTSIISAISWVLIAFASIALLAASFGIINTLYMSVVERTREIGLMKALGMSSARIFGAFSTEAILIGFWGSLTATLASRGVGATVNAVAKSTFAKDLPGLQLMEHTISGTLIVMLIIMLIAFLAGTLPARKASKQNPINALRYE
jgi:putative ABC transport system permease protein